jgi:hypothetical protein
MKRKSKSVYTCNEELDIMCANCVRRDTINLLASEVASMLLGGDGERLVIERKGHPFSEETNRISGGGNCRSSAQHVIAHIISRRFP